MVTSCTKPRKFSA